MIISCTLLLWFSIAICQHETNLMPICDKRGNIVLE